MMCCVVIRLVDDQTTLVQGSLRPARKLLHTLLDWGRTEAVTPTYVLLFLVRLSLVFSLIHFSYSCLARPPPHVSFQPIIASLVFQTFIVDLCTLTLMATLARCSAGQVQALVWRMGSGRV